MYTQSSVQTDFLISFFLARCQIVVWDEQDHAVAGLGAGVVTTLCLNPLDLLKIKFQVDTGAPTGGIGRQMFHALRDIQQRQGWKGLYRGISPNVAGNASSWGLYFLLCVSL